MANPWLKKNPLMSMWLSGANRVANTARGQVLAEAKRQTAANSAKAADEVFSFWFGSTAAARKSPKRKLRR